MIENSINWFQNLVETVKPDTIFTVFVSLSIFILGLIFKWSFEAWKRRRYLKSRTRFFVESAESIIEPLERQAEEFNNLAEAIGDLKNRKLAFNVVTDLNFFFFSPEIIADIHAYNSVRWLWWKKIDESTLKDISNVVTATQKHLDHTRYNFDNFLKKEDRNSTDWYQASNSVFRFNDYLINQFRANGQPADDEFFHDFNKTVHEWTEDRDDYDLEHIRDNLIHPLKDICKKHSGDPRALQILPTLVECSNVFERFKENRNNYQELFEKDSDQVKEHKESFEEAINELSKLT